MNIRKGVTLNINYILILLSTLKLLITGVRMVKKDKFEYIFYRINMQRVTDIKDFIANFDRMNPNDVSIQASLLNESSFEEVILFGLFKQLYIRRKVYVSTPGFHHNLYSAKSLISFGFFKK
jgi:hypothetical protein